MFVREADNHIKRANYACKISDEALFRAIFMAVGSMRMQSRRFWGIVLPPAYTEYMMTSDLNAVNKLFPDFASLSLKRAAINYANENKTAIWFAYQQMNAKEFFHYLVENIPGMGPAKAAFVVQLSKGKLGCLDTVNVKRYGLPEIPPTPKKYLETLEQLGITSGRMWRDWCSHVAERDGLITSKLSEAHASFVETGRYNPYSLFKQRNLFDEASYAD
jgi:hypothetical protein